MNLEQLKEKIFQRWLTWSCRPGRIKKHLRAGLPRPDSLGTINRRKIRVAALQLELKLFKSPLAYADEMHRRVKEAAGQGARLIAFPEYNNISLLGLLPGVEQMLEDSMGNPDNQNGGDPAGLNIGDIKITDVFAYMTPAVNSVVNATFSNLAAAYNTWIMAGSYALAHNGGIVNRAFLFGPDGSLIGIQDKVHLLPMEAEWKLARGTSFSVFKTPLGNLAFPVCMDATYFESFRILEQKGAEIALLPIANLEPYNYWMALRGIWPRVQESPIYGIKSALVGDFYGLTFTGRSGIFAPLEITPKKDGVIAEVDTFDREALAVADLDLEALAALRREHPWRDRNEALYRSYFPQTYRTESDSQNRDRQSLDH